MGIIPRYNFQQVQAVLDASMNRIEQAILQTLSYLGEQCINLAREQGSYTDQTGNLRSSVGYVIVKNGVIVVRNFRRNQNLKPGQKKRSRGYGKAGVQAGEELAETLARNYPTGYALIVVAGMNYAVSVESKGYTVLHSAEMLAKTELPRMLEQLKGRISQFRTQP